MMRELWTLANCDNHPREQKEARRALDRIDETAKECMGRAFGMVLNDIENGAKIDTPKMEAGWAFRYALALEEERERLTRSE